MISELLIINLILKIYLAMIVFKVEYENHPYKVESKVDEKVSNFIDNFIKKL